MKCREEIYSGTWAVKGKALKTIREEGVLELGKKTSQFVRKKIGEKQQRNMDFDCYKDVLFIDGCGTVLPTSDVQDFTSKNN